MRTIRKQVFADALTDYFRKFFTASAARDGLTDILFWVTPRTYPECVHGMPHYPACEVSVNGRTIVSPYRAQYDCTIMLGIKGDDPETVFLAGAAWEDILEDAIREDWTLGGTVIDVVSTVSIEPVFTGTYYELKMDFVCDVDCGGYVYDRESEKAGTGKDMPEMPEEDTDGE